VFGLYQGGEIDFLLQKKEETNTERQIKHDKQGCYITQVSVKQLTSDK
jgi:hypothetical protein